MFRSDISSVVSACTEVQYGASNIYLRLLLLFFFLYLYIILALIKAGFTIKSELCTQTENEWCSSFYVI